MEDGDCHVLYKNVRKVPTLFNVIDKTYYLIWWILSDNDPKRMGVCEKMAALVSEASLLKANDVRLKRATFWSKTCIRCHMSALEDARHIVMQCPSSENSRIEMYEEIANLECKEIDDAISSTDDIL